MRLKLRGHNLLCIQGFVGKGYSPGFVANMTRVVDSLGDGRDVTVVDGPDALCAACPHLDAASGCTLHGSGTEEGIVRQDRDVMARLGLHAEQTIAWSEILQRIRDHVAPDDLDDICGSCPWLPLGHCKAGLRRLSSSTR